MTTPIRPLGEQGSVVAGHGLNLQGFNIQGLNFQGLKVNGQYSRAA